MISFFQRPPQLADKSIKSFPSLKSGTAVYARCGLLLIIFSAVSGPASTMAQKHVELLETGQAPRLTEPAKKGELTIVSYNIRWRTGNDLEKIADWLKEKQPAVIALQEVDRARGRTGKRNNAQALAEKLGMYYAWAAPPRAPGAKEEETGVEILSPYPLSDITRIVLPHDGPGKRQRVALGATVKIGLHGIRVYSVHSETRLSELRKIDQFKAVLADLEKHPRGMPAIVTGDLNTWERPMLERTRKLFITAGFHTPFPDDGATFKRKIVLFDLELKLDWIWLRGFESRSFGIDRTFTPSDHFPIWATVTLKQDGGPLADGPP